MSSSPRNTDPRHPQASVQPATEPCTVHALRTAESTDAKHRLCELMVEHQVSGVELAAEIGRSESITSRICDHARPDVQLQALDLVRLCKSRSPRLRAVGVGMLEHAATFARHVVRAERRDESISDVIAHVAEMSIEYAELQSALLRLRHVDSITPEQARVALKELRDVRSMIDAAEGLLEQRSLSIVEGPKRRG